jgi:hypothetical protein
MRCPRIVLSFSPLVALMAGCAKHAPPYHLNPHPVRTLTVVGTVPENLAVQMTAVWHATVLNDVCAIKMPWPVGGRFPRLARLPVRLVERSGDHAVWQTSWDLLTPQPCGWRLWSLELQADRGQQPTASEPPQFLETRIAFLCAADCPPNSPRINDDASQAVVQYCSFVHSTTLNGKVNPCVYGPDGRLRGPKSPVFKEQHALREGQNEIHFALIELNSSAGHQ